MKWTRAQTEAGAKVLFHAEHGAEEWDGYDPMYVGYLHSLVVEILEAVEVAGPAPEQHDETAGER